MELKRNLVDQLYSLLKERIITLGLEPGARLTLQDLAQEFEVSQTPIRDALMRLSKDGLVRFVPAVGYYVIKLSVRDVIEIYDLRQLLEGYAVRSSVAHMDTKKLREIRQKIERQQDEPHILNQKLHLEIVKNSDNKRLQDLYTQIYDFVRICQYTHRRISGGIAKAAKEHLALIDAILQKNAEKAKQILEMHIGNARDEIIETLEKHPNAKKLDPVG